MKIKSTLTLLFLGLTTTIFSQTDTKWSTLGIAASSGDFFGTTNAYPIDFKTNNILRASLSPTGLFNLNNLAGAGTRLLQTDASGNVIFLPAGSPSQVLFGDGTWGAVPTPTTSGPWAQSGTNVFTTNNVGIGTSFPLFPLDVYGDMRVSNNLYVGGGIVISQKMQATSSLKTDTVHSVTGETKFTSKVILKQQFQVDGTSLFNGTLQANDISTTGSISAVNSTITGFLATNKLILGSAIDDINIVSQSTGTAKFIHIGFPYGPSLPPATTCIKPFVGTLTNISTRALITNPGFSNVFDFNNDGLNGYIDYGYDISEHPRLIDTNGVEAPVAPVPSLKINSVCNGDVEIAKGGGFVSAGNYFEVGNPIRNGLIVSNINALGSRVAQRVTKKSYYPANYVGAVNEFNTQFFVNRDFIKALSVNNTVTNTNGDETFVIYGDGRTAIGSSYVAPGYKLAVNGKIITEEVVVQLRSNWPDYVFEKNYKLKSLSEIEDFIKQNNHLENIPTASEIEKNGVSIGSLVSKQMEKIEELTLYLIQQQKQIEALQKEVKSLQK